MSYREEIMKEVGPQNNLIEHDSRYKSYAVNLGGEIVLLSAGDE
jgi:hypothetical protein